MDCWKGFSNFHDCFKLEYKALGDLGKRAKVRDLIYLFSFDKVALQEKTKPCSPSFHLFCSIGELESMNGWYSTLSLLQEDN